MNLANYLDRPIAFQRSFVGLGIGVTGALMLSQAVYWARRSEDEDGWFFKSQVEWEEETGLRRAEQETARKRLIALGAMEEERRGIPAKLFYRVNFQELEAQLLTAEAARNQDCGNPAIKSAEAPQSGTPESSTPDCGNPANRTAVTPQSKIRKTTSETTSETTADTSPAGADAPAEPPAPRRFTAPNGTIYEIPGELSYPLEKSKTFKAWMAYAITYFVRYAAWPVWNASVAGQMAKFIDRVGADAAPRVAVHYVRRVAEQFVVQQMHPVRLLLADAEKWHTQASTGTGMTRVQAQQEDRTAGNLDAIEEAKRLSRERAARRAGQSGEGCNA
ncbi:hypothetical protein [Acidovorax sp. PRC11]|uniref:hypothetical protein n=1 Tax=Acidovorax sp. PRC11 TaxID=2962592 RepID=UPI002880EA1A|nr:hypothetical protein [Acidovorax sp. PRC11]MDT0138081.1 hypothetical protein [Acidovorax sp. PRC11]